MSKPSLTMPLAELRKATPEQIAGRFERELFPMAATMDASYEFHDPFRKAKRTGAKPPIAKRIDYATQTVTFTEASTKGDAK